MFGEDARDLTLAELRSMVGLVEQDSPLMRRTIRSNLTYGAPDASDEAAQRAMSLAQLTRVVSDLPPGLDTELGEGGRGLSGGQKQRLAIARTLLREPQLVLLDEATANLDPSSETALTQALRAISAERHVLAIARRMSTVRAADRILVMAGGGIIGRGTYRELYASNEA